MHYTEEIVIDAPRARVVGLFTDPAHFADWQPGLDRYELVSGSQAQPGAKAELTTRVGGREMHMTETVQRNYMPDGLDVVYETKGIWNRNANRFVAETPSTTRWISENEFRFEGLLRKGLELWPGSFKKQSLEIMERFKAFAEGANSE